jgi:hypothetical protein
LPLTHVNLPGLETARGVHFPMMHKDMSVRVFVTRAAIIGAAVIRDNESCLARFDAGRAFFELLAREKFDPTRPAVKITIDREDLLGPPDRE